MGDARSQKRLLGRSGLWVHEIGMGGWAIGGPDWNLNEMGWTGVCDEDSIAALRRGYELGANFFDTADVYGHGRSERLIGQLICEVSRDNIIIGTKVGYFRGTAPCAYHPLHMQHQIEMSLENLRTDYIDVYYFHNFNFGADDQYLEPAIETINRLKEEKLIRTVGMRGPHRFTLDRNLPSRPKEDKYERFLSIAELLQPDLIQLRFNMLTPRRVRRRVFDWADENNVGIVINKPLAQGLLLDKYDPDRMPEFGPGDHRRRKEWFSPQPIRLLKPRLARLKERFGARTSDLVRAAVQYCLAQSPRCCVVVGFKNRAQVEMNLGAAGQALSQDDVRFIEETMDGIHEDLGRYFQDGWS